MVYYRQLTGIRKLVLPCSFCDSWAVHSHFIDVDEPERIQAEGQA